MTNVDINCDLGEGYGPYRMGDDAALMKVITSANIACGFHAGDPSIMVKTVQLAIDNGVDIGAHVGFADIQGFGRRPLNLDASELRAMTWYQLGAAGHCAGGGQEGAACDFPWRVGQYVFCRCGTRGHADGCDQGIRRVAHDHRAADDGNGNGCGERGLAGQARGVCRSRL